MTRKETESAAKVKLESAIYYYNEAKQARLLAERAENLRKDSMDDCIDSLVKVAAYTDEEPESKGAPLIVHRDVAIQNAFIKAAFSMMNPGTFQLCPPDYVEYSDADADMVLKWIDAYGMHGFADYVPNKGTITVIIERIKK